MFNKFIGLMTSKKKQIDKLARDIKSLDQNVIKHPESEGPTNRYANLNFDKMKRKLMSLIDQTIEVKPGDDQKIARKKREEFIKNDMALQGISFPNGYLSTAKKIAVEKTQAIKGNTDKDYNDYISEGSSVSFHSEVDEIDPEEVKKQAMLAICEEFLWYAKEDLNDTGKNEQNVLKCNQDLDKALKLLNNGSDVAAITKRPSVHMRELRLKENKQEIERSTEALNESAEVNQALVKIYNLKVDFHNVIKTVIDEKNIITMKLRNTIFDASIKLRKKLDKIEGELNTLGSKTKNIICLDAVQKEIKRIDLYRDAVGKFVAMINEPNINNSNKGSRNRSSSI